MNSVVTQQRVLSGMRPTGQLHLGHFHGVLNNWVKLQHEYECLFFVADWHALTTHYDQVEMIQASVWDMVVDWLAAGVNPGSATLFIQSHVPEHAELHLLLSMMTPLGWLERVPSYKDQQEKLKEKDLATYGFLGYPLLQSADILAYKAGLVPVGADQVAHVELTREVARRFNYLFGRGPDFEKGVAAALRKMGKKSAALYSQWKKQYLEQGDEKILATAQALVSDHAQLTLVDKERLLGDLEGSGKVILPEPHALLTANAKMPGLDGQKMSKSYGNTIPLRAAPEVIVEKIRIMPTDPARIRRSDPGSPALCPVWPLHLIYSDATTQEWVQSGCTSAGIGCIECKKKLSDAIEIELAPMRERAVEYERHPDRVKSIVAEGAEAAREIAKETLEEVRSVMGLGYR